jgi:hypothetical protein
VPSSIRHIPKLATIAQQGDSLALSDALEGLIATGADTTSDRTYAYQVVSSRDADTAASAFARAAITGRVVQSKGLSAAGRVREVERYAIRSRELDPTFRDGAATRLLGTLYVMAPATLLEHGDSETGLELLEQLTAAGPEVPENHLRLAEAYVTLHDPDPARPNLCFSLAHQDALRRDDQALLKWLIADVGPPDCAARRCTASGCWRNRIHAPPAAVKSATIDSTKATAAKSGLLHRQLGEREGERSRRR